MIKRLNFLWNKFPSLNYYYFETEYAISILFKKTTKVTHPTKKLVIGYLTQIEILIPMRHNF